MNTTREQRRQVARDNLKWPLALKEIPRDDWPITLRGLRLSPDRVLRSRTFLCQEFIGKLPAVVRLSFCRAEMTGDRWTEGITWDELQRLKGEAGYEDWCAVEIYPPALQVVNVANMRHLWVLMEPPPYMWGVT